MNRASVDISKTEHNALQEASADAGMYIEALGKFNLAEMSPDEWSELIKVACFSYAEAMRHVVAAGEEPPL